MNNKLINWRKSLIELFPEATERVKSEKDEWCPTCNGLGLVKTGNSIGVCYTCNGTGIIKSCECGGKIKRGYTLCENCIKEKEAKKENERFENANKIRFEDYDGLFLWGDNVVDKDELIDIVCDQIFDYGEAMKYVYATKKYKLFDKIDLIDIIIDKCEDGYEDIETYFNFKDSDLIKAQKHLDKFIKKHEGILDIYYEDYNNVVLLEDLIKKIDSEVK